MRPLQVLIALVGLSVTSGFFRKQPGRMQGKPYGRFSNKYRPYRPQPYYPSRSHSYEPRGYEPKPYYPAGGKSYESYEKSGYEPQPSYPSKGDNYDRYEQKPASYEKSYNPYQPAPYSRRGRPSYGYGYDVRRNKCKDPFTDVAGFLDLIRSIIALVTPAQIDHELNFLGDYVIEACSNGEEYVNDEAEEKDAGTGSPPPSSLGKNELRDCYGKAFNYFKYAKLGASSCVDRFPSFREYIKVAGSDWHLYSEELASYVEHNPNDPAVFAYIIAAFQVRDADGDGCVDDSHDQFIVDLLEAAGHLLQPDHY